MKKFAKRIKELAAKLGLTQALESKSITKEQIEAGHGGMDTLTLQAFFGAALSGEEMPIDVYDAASWMVITCLTEASIANGGMPIDIPDFTGGRWVLREPKDVIPLD